MAQCKYPHSKRDEAVEDDYHGTKIKDPYRWLEDPKSAETKKWIESQISVTDKVFEECNYRQKLFERIKEANNFSKTNPLFKEGGKFFFWKNDGLQNQDVLYMIESLEDPNPKVVLDANLLDPTGCSNIDRLCFSHSGKTFTFFLHKAGSDWVTVFVKDVNSGPNISREVDTLSWVRFGSVAWIEDDSGFYYTRYPIPKSAQQNENLSLGTETDQALNQSVYFHKLATPQSEDKLVFHIPDQPTWMIDVGVSDDKKYLLFHISVGCEDVNRLYYSDLSKIEYDSQGLINPVKLYDNFNARFRYLSNDGSIFYLYTNDNAPRSKLIKIDINDPQKKSIDVIKENENVMESLGVINNNLLIVQFTEHAKHVLHLYDLHGKLIKIFDIPIGSVGFESYKRTDSEAFFKLTTFTSPGTIYHLQFDKENNPIVKVYLETKLNGIDSSQIECKQIFYESLDGTRIPMFIISPKDAKMDGTNPVLLYGYGGFNISLTPNYSSSRLVWVYHFKATYVIANIRGGNEYGEDWHKGGILDRKQNTFDDFKSAARYLIDHKYTNSKKIAIMGGSNGGLLVTACVNQDPELYAVGIAQVPVIDMLRFHKFTIGHAWITDYGCSEKPDNFKYIIKYSPLHTIKKGKPFPALLLLTADHDDRVVPAHSFKYIAEIQHQLGSEEYQVNPLAIRIDVDAGHGSGKSLEKSIREIADIYAFVAKYLDAKWE